MDERIPVEYDRFDCYDVDAMHADKGQAGDVCPWCGSPIAVDQNIVDEYGDPVEGPVEDWPYRLFHAWCAAQVLAQKHREENRSLEEFSDG